MIQRAFDQKKDQYKGVEENSRWWDVVLKIANIVVKEEGSLSQEAELKKHMSDCGFSSEEVDRAFDWYDMAQRSGNIMDIIGSLAPSKAGIRVEHPFERVSISDDIWRGITTCLRLGLLGNDTTERLLEGLREIDTRDWEEEEVCTFFAEMLRLCGSAQAGKRLKKLMKGRAVEFFC